MKGWAEKYMVRRGNLLFEGVDIINKYGAIIDMGQTNQSTSYYQFFLLKIIDFFSLTPSIK